MKSLLIQDQDCKEGDDSDDDHSKEMMIQG